MTPQQTYIHPCPDVTTTLAMEKSVSGFKQHGSWNDIVEHGERITSALVELDVTGDAFDEWNEWRPKADDRLHDDVNKKTAEKAAVGEGTGEKKDKSPDEDIVKAGKKLSESGARASPKDAAGDMQQSAAYVVRAVDTVTRKVFRAVETSVYQHLMTKVSPYYFDNSLISANATRTSSLTSDTDEFVLEVNINDDDLKEDVERILEDYDDIDRWHMDTPKETDTAVEAEGQEPPEDESPLVNSVAQVREPKEEHKTVSRPE